jgi:hypothetical protein
LPFVVPDEWGGTAAFESALKKVTGESLASDHGQVHANAGARWDGLLVHLPGTAGSAKGGNGAVRTRSADAEDAPDGLITHDRKAVGPDVRRLQAARVKQVADVSRPVPTGCA